MAMEAELTNYFLIGFKAATILAIILFFDKFINGLIQHYSDRISILKSSGGVATFEPFIRYHTFDDFSINFTVILRAQEFVDNYLVKHEFIKKLHKRYAKEGIVIPYPIRAINYDQEKAFEASAGIGKKGA